MPKVSVVVIAYNVAAYIARCLDSLVNQTLADIEIIVVDNGSTDGTRSIIDGYLNSDERVSIVHIEHESSPGKARNAGLDVSRGKYIMFPDGDDWVDLSYLETMVDALEKTGAEIANSNLTIMYQDGCTKPKEKVHYPKLYCLNNETALRIMAYELKCEIDITASASNKLYLREFLVDHGIRFMEHVYYEDQGFSYETLINARKVICVPGVTYRYLKRIGSITQSYFDKYADGLAEVYRRIKSKLQEKGVYENYYVCYHRSLEHCFNLIVRQIFEYVNVEDERKAHIRYAFDTFKNLIVLDEYFEICSSEEIRRHIQPLVLDTTIN